MRFSASAFYTLHSPKRCERRVFLHAHGEPEGKPSPFDELIKELGRRHERGHLAQFKEYADLSQGSLEERIDKTADAMRNGAMVIYQGVLRSPLRGSEVDVIGSPDFLIREGATYKIRDCKLSRRVTEDRHVEVLRQVELYGWLFQQTTGNAPAALELYLGDRSIVRLPYFGAERTLNELEEIVALSTRSDEPYSPVGWSKCGGCGFHDRCWRLAEEKQDVALVYDLDQGTALRLHADGVADIPRLLETHTPDTLAELRRPHGATTQRVGKKAARILLQAGAMASKKEKRIAPLALPEGENLVMFDLEGLPPQFDDLEKVYLWGTQVYGKKPGGYLPALATFGRDGDKRGWLDFLKNSQSIFEAYGDIPFVHWAPYETIKIKLYLQRYGDVDSTGERVLHCCVDLLKITRDALVLPDVSYSLKVVEKRAGFTRSMEEFGGDWSIVQYIRAVETEDDNLRQEIMSEILKYNEEDLKATWAVLEWLRGLS